MDKKRKKSNNITIPTILNIARIVLTFVVVYMIITERSITYTVVVFAVAAITDWFDGRIARKYNLVSDFGRKADMLADRFLWIGTAFAFLAVFGIRGQLNIIHGIQLLLIMSREIISAPSAIVAFFSGKGFPHARYVAKITTFTQGFALPALMLSIYYPVWENLAFPLSILLGIVGTASGFYYIADVQRIEDRKTSKKE